MEYLLLIVLVIAGVIIKKLSSEVDRVKKKSTEEIELEKKRFNRKNDQLSAALEGGYGKQPILNTREKQVFHILNKLINSSANGLYCFPQVSCGEIFTHPKRSVFKKTVNSKRVDFCIADSKFNPLAIIEYQGSGHKISGDSGFRDATKAQVSANAGVKYIQLFNGEKWEEKLNLELSNIINSKKQV